MKRLIFVLLLATLAALIWAPVGNCFAVPTFGCHRDSMCVNQFYEPPCDFPPVPNPCAVPCRPPAFQPQAVPCAFETACPSVQLPCYGVAYGRNPYPLFRFR
jgi:hypothetical protein